MSTICIVDVNSTVLIISPTVLNTLHSTDGITDRIPHSTDDIPHSIEHPPQYCKDIPWGATRRSLGDAIIEDVLLVLNIGYNVQVGYNAQLLGF